MSFKALYQGKTTHIYRYGVVWMETLAMLGRCTGLGPTVAGEQETPENGWAFRILFVTSLANGGVHVPEINKYAAFCTPTY